MYQWKRIEELAWVGVVAAALFLLELGMNWNGDALTDPRAYLTAAIGGLVRAVAGAILAKVRPAP